jgi:hypothetical protein
MKRTEPWGVTVHTSTMKAYDLIGLGRSIVGRTEQLRTGKNAPAAHTYAREILEASVARVAEKTTQLDNAWSNRAIRRAMKHGKVTPAHARFILECTTLRDQLKLYQRREKTNQDKPAGELLKILFPGKSPLSFLHGTPVGIVRQGEELLKFLRAPSATQLFTDQGGELVVTRFENALTALTASLKGTLTPAPTVSRVTVAVACREAMEAIRDYVIRLHAVADPARPGSQALVDHLRTSLADVVSTRKRAAKPATPKSTLEKKISAASPSNESIAPHAVETDPAAPLAVAS